MYIVQRNSQCKLIAPCNKPNSFESILQCRLDVAFVFVCDECNPYICCVGAGGSCDEMSSYCVRCIVGGVESFEEMKRVTPREEIVGV